MNCNQHSQYSFILCSKKTRTLYYRQELSNGNRNNITIPYLSFSFHLIKILYAATTQKVKMNILEPESGTALNNHDCKRHFLLTQVSDLQSYKEKYQKILQQLKDLNRHQNQKKEEKIFQSSAEFPPFQDKRTFQSNKHLFQYQQKGSSMASLLKQLQSLNTETPGENKNDIFQENSSSLEDYLKTQEEQIWFYPKLLRSFGEYQNCHQKQIHDRQKQLQEIEQLKQSKQFQCHSITTENSDKTQPKVPQKLIKILQNEKNRAVQKSISTFDFNRRALEIIKKEMVFLKLKKARLQKCKRQGVPFKSQMNQKCQNKGQNKESFLSASTEPSRLGFQSTATSSQGQMNNANKLTKGLQTPKLQSSKIRYPSRNQISAFEKIVTIEQKDRFLISELEQKNLKLEKKLKQKLKQKTFLQQKYKDLKKEVESFDWNHSFIQDSSFQVDLRMNEKLKRVCQDNQLGGNLSILDRTQLVTLAENLADCSFTSVNQSIICPQKDQN